MSAASNPVTLSLNLTTKLNAALVGLGCAAVIAGTGGVPSCVMENRTAAALELPAASRATPAGMSTRMVPSDAGETSKAYEEPLPEKLATPPWAAVPERTTSPASNPVTFSLNSTAKLIVAAPVGLDCAAVIAGVLPRWMLVASEASFAFPAASCTRPAGMLAVSNRPPAGSATSNSYAG